MLNIIQLNIKSLNSSRNLLEIYLNQHQIDICILSEIWLKPDHKIYIKDYQFVSACRLQGYGGVGILVKNDIKYNLLTSLDFNPIESIAIETLNLKKNLTIVSIYIPPNIRYNTINTKFKQLINHYNNKTNAFVAGDINAHNPLWESNSKNDNRGSIIADHITTSNFIVLNNGNHTFLSASTGQTSAIDITMAHSNISNDFNWTKTFENLASDHFILNSTYHTDKAKNNSDIPSKKINYNKINQDLSNYDPNEINSIETFENQLEDVIKAHTIILPKNNKYVPKYWWNNYLKKLWNKNYLLNLKTNTLKLNLK